MAEGGDRLLAADVDAGVAAAVAELDRSFRAAAMDFTDQPRQAGNEVALVNAELAAAMPSGLFRRGHLDGDEAGAAAHPRHVIGDGLVGDVAFLIRAACGHRRHHDPIGDLHRSDARGSEQNVHGTRRELGAHPPLEGEGRERSERGGGERDTDSHPTPTASALLRRSTLPLQGG
jgi:hypothetical protein